VRGRNATCADETLGEQPPDQAALAEPEAVVLVDEQLARNAPQVIWSFELDNRQLVVTEELLRVAGFLTAFTGLNFTVFLLTDKTYREEFGSEIVDQLRQSLAVRAVYRSAPGLRDDAEASSTISPT
jgi:hypothetical protein